MNNILKATKLDLMIIKQYKSTAIWLILCCIAIGIGFQNIIIGTVWAMCIIGIKCLSITFDAEEREGIKKLYEFIPLSSAHKVSGRYLFCVSTGTILSVIIIALQSVINLLKDQSKLSVTEIFTAFFLGTAIMLFNVSYQFPVYYKFGIVKGRMSGLAIIMILGAVAGAFVMRDRFSLNTFIRPLSEYFVLSVIAFLITVLCTFISLMISIKIYKTKK